MNKKDWIAFFRTKTEETFSELKKTAKSSKEKASEINRRIKSIRDSQIESVQKSFIQSSWSNNALLHEILLLTYASYVVMLEYRNKVWEYDYMAFARRIGELWEPFCKLPFEFSIKPLTLIEPPDFDTIQNTIKQQALNYISKLNITNDERHTLAYYYTIPWEMVDSGGIKLALDLHFMQNGIHYNCDFKSGFSSNEKGNTNRLLLVASIYHSLGKNEKTYLFVRQNEDENNHYLQTLKNSQYWEVFCADKCYVTIKKFTGFDMREWLDHNVDWKNDISDEFRTHLESNDLLKYLTW